jgi:hypothetical protein
VGVDKYNATNAATYIAGTNREINSFVKDSILPFGSNIFYESSAFIEDASFIRLKTISFKYKPEKRIMDKVAILFSLSFENLITLSKYKGYDPEATIYTDNNFSDNAIDHGAYPNPKGVYAGIQLKF